MHEAERTASKVYRTRNEASADVFDYIERFCNPRRRRSKLGYISPMEFEARTMLAEPDVHEIGSSSECALCCWWPAIVIVVVA